MYKARTFKHISGACCLITRDIRDFNMGCSAVDHRMIVDNIFLIIRYGQIISVAVGKLLSFQMEGQYSIFLASFGDQLITLSVGTRVVCVLPNVTFRFRGHGLSVYGNYQKLEQSL